VSFAENEVTASIGSTDGGHGDPIEALRALCLESPNRAEPRVDLARALLDARRAAEAVIPAEQAVALAPHLAAAVEVRDAVLQALHAGDPDLVVLELTAAHDPGNADAHLALGAAYAALARPHDAERHFKLALALGRARDAHVDLGALYLTVKMWDAAEHHARAALASEDHGSADDTVIAMAHQTLASVFEARGDGDASERQLDRAYARQSLFRQAAANAPFTTLVLVTRRAGNIPYQTLLPPRRFDRTVWYMEHARLEQIADMPPYAVVLNAIGDPDAAMESQATVDAFVACCTRPVLNHPAPIGATFRHRIRETLAGVDGVVAPLTGRVTAQEIATKGLAATVAGAGLTPPVLVRPVGSHGGKGLVLAGDEAALEASPVARGQDAYVSQFHDYRSPDGYYRKYRMIFVDRRAFPYHLAISRQWMVHHETTDMANDPARISEELEFLVDPRGAIGARAMTAVEAIGRRLDLDYAGIDFTMTSDGQVLVFEANATMLTHLEPEAGPFAAKNRFIQPIIDAFQARLALAARDGPERS
jgi:tetratricopeptide (TPR) repeat protein